ncbi:MAG TPA: hypothetical protein VE861_16655 [Gemmatimonadaceae bacterium]|nr:hypothetical protein [Gemmatimonadaceae bacterium]
MQAPTIVFASLGAIAITGAIFAATTLLGGAPGIATLFLLMPVTAVACLRAVRRARTALFAVSIGATAPLMVGIVLTWPTLGGMAPYLAGMGAIVGALGGMLSRPARDWHASVSAHRRIGL